MDFELVSIVDRRCESGGFGEPSRVSGRVSRHSKTRPLTRLGSPPASRFLLFVQFPLFELVVFFQLFQTFVVPFPRHRHVAVVLFQAVLFSKTGSGSRAEEFAAILLDVLPMFIAQS